MTYQEDIQNIIASCEYFSKIPIEGKNLLISFAELISLEEGEVLFNQGDSSDYFYILASGNLSAFLTHANGKKIVVGQVLAYEPVGELGALALKPRSMSIIAKKNSILLRFDIKKFKEICVKYPVILADLSQHIVSRFLETIKTITRITTDINILLIYANNENNVYLKNKFLTTKVNDLWVIPCEKIKLEEVEKKINEASFKQMNILFIMQEWQQDFIDFIKQWLTHVYIVIEKEEKDFTNHTKILLHNLSQSEIVRRELIILHKNNATRFDNTRKWLEKADFNLHHHLRILEQQDYHRLIRFMNGKAVTLVLGGGGAKGLSHLGVIKSILENKLSIDAIGGTSIGAAVAACYALNLNYDQAVVFIDKLKIASLKALRLTNLTWPLISLFSSDPATSLLIHLMDNALMEDLLIPYFAVTSNIKNKTSVILKRGLIWEAVRASVSVPGLFPPLVYNGQLFVDGGLLNNLPVDIMRENVGNKNTIIASSLSRRDLTKQSYVFPPVLSLSKTLLLKLGIGRKQYVFPTFFETFIESLLLGSSEREDYNARIADILIRPNFKGFKTFSYESEKAQEKLIQAGYEEANKAINQFLRNRLDE